MLAPAMLLAADPKQLPEGEGRKSVEGACASCHGLNVVTAKPRGKDEWQELVKTMVARGAPLAADEAGRVAAYLARNFGPKDRAKELVEDVCSLCHELGRIKDQELTKEEWREFIKGMISEGAPVTEEEFNLIVDYLGKNFGTGQK